MDLGMALEKFETDPEAARALVGGAHQELQRAVAELRNLARGIHPAVLTDRGLDAALSALAARSPIPVRLEVELRERPPASVEATAYFVVAEALVNTAKHAHAHGVDVRVRLVGDTLHVEVADDGVGGAAEQPGGGIAGLADRAFLGRRDADHQQSGGRANSHRRGAPVRIVIAEDSVLLRDGLTRMLTDHGHEMVGAIDDAVGLVQLVDETSPDLVILDVRMPPTHTDEGIRAALELRKRRPDLPVLVLSQYVEENYASELLSGDLGGVAYVLKDRVTDVGQFLETVERVAGGGTAIDPEVVSQLIARTRRHEPISDLSPREREVLGLMAEGRTNAAIADTLVITQRAVEKHVKSIFQKLRLSPVDTDHRRVLAVLRYLEAR
jgi:DNA-binding NarL/FixJ family response regulator